MKFTGLDAITKKMDQLAKFAGDLDGDIANVSFDPQDPASIDRAIQEVNAAVDAKAASYGRNDWVENAATELKEQAREAILERAAAARLNRSDEE